MEKTPRYTQRERNMVLGFAAQYKDIIENKRTDAESNRKKDEVWRVIAKEFNARVYHQRTAKQLRQLYKNMKLLLKKDLSIDGRTKDFMDILNALSQQSVLHPFMAYRQNMDGEYDEQKGTNSLMNDPVENDVVVIKSEELSDNEQSNDNDDTMSNKDIPEICMEDDDDDDDNYNINNMNNNHHNNSNNDHINNNNHHHHHGIINNRYSSNSSNNNMNNNRNNMNSTNNSNLDQQQQQQQQQRCDSLITLAIEERKRKIDLLNAQIDYWKALTRKLENTTTNNHCHCHITPSPPQPPRINGVNQS